MSFPWSFQTSIIHKIYILLFLDMVTLSKNDRTCCPGRVVQLVGALSGTMKSSIPSQVYGGNWLMVLSHIDIMLSFSLSVALSLSPFFIL